jgi:hypothetical protein
MEIKNTTKRPVKVPLPGGKRLFLSPNGIGQIMPKDADHPPVKKLIEAGDLEIVGGGRTKGAGSLSGSGGIGSSQSSGGAGGVRHTGDR